MVEATGSPEAGARVGASVADIATGMYAYAGILAALVQRDRTGEGSTLEVTMLEALGEWMSQPVYWSRDGARDWQRSGARHATIAPYGSYPGSGRPGLPVRAEPPRLGAALRAGAAPARAARGPAVPDQLRPRRARAGAGRRPRRLLRRPHRRPRCWPPSTRPASPTRSCAPRGSSPTTPSSRLATAGATVRHPGGEMRAMLPPVTVAGSEPRMDPVPALGRAHRRRPRGGQRATGVR